MTVEELIKRLRRFPKNAEVFILPDELECDDEGFFADLHRISEVVDQELYVETNCEFRVITEVMVKFEEDRAYSRTVKDER
jgi:hypothetical protein